MNWKEIVQDLITKNSDRIRRVTAPLRDHFGVSYFTYHHIDEKGNYQVLVDRPDWAEHYVEKKFFLTDPYLRDPKVYKSGSCLIESFGSEDYKQELIRSGKALNMDLGVLWIEKLGTSVEFFGFSAKRDSSSLEKVYLNHPNLLKSFATYFKQELKDLIETQENPLPELAGPNFFTKEPVHPSLDDKIRLDYLKSFGISLTPRELECLEALSEGKSAKETANLLGLSPRTIEFYLENIKNKLSCYSKQDLLEIAKLYF